MSPAPKKKQSPEEIVKPSIHIEGDKEHALKLLFREDDAPIIKSVGYAPLAGLPGHGRYIAYIVTSQADKVLSIEVEQPNLKGIAEESAKMAFVETFMGTEE